MNLSRPLRLLLGRSLNEPLYGLFRVSMATVVGLSTLLWSGGPLGSIPAAMANGGVDGTFTQTTTADFSAACTVLAGSIPTPELISTVVSPAGDGEIRLTPTLEDYFDGTAVNTALWLEGLSRPFYTQTVTITNGVAVLDGNYLRSQTNFQSTRPRFFEARARHLVTATNVGWADLGFYRDNPPFYYETNPFPATSALRLFVTNPFGDVVVNARDGDASQPLTVVNVNPDPDAALYHIYRLEWDAGAGGDTRIYIDGDQVGVVTGTATLDTWVFLYQQDPSYLNPTNSPLHVDWVRAGQYAPSGTYTSCARDAGGVVNWSTLSATATTPTGTTASFETRTSLDGSAWSNWVAVSGSTIASPSGRYFQYRTALGSSNAHVSPEVGQVVVEYFGPSAIQFTPASATLDPGAVQAFSGQAVDANGRAVSSLVSTWGLTNGGGTLSPTGVFTAGLPAGIFTNTIAMTVTTTGGPVTDRATVTVRDLAPTASISGTTTVAEGSQIGLTGSGQDPNGLSVGLSWDLDNNGTFETAGSAANYTGLDDGAFTVRLRALETGGAGLSTVVTRTITVTNVAPVVTITGAPSGSVPAGTTVTLGQSVSDAGTADTHTFAWDVTRNGQPYGSGAGASFAFTSDSGGAYVVTVEATDDDGGVDSDTVTVTVSGGYRLALPAILKSP